MPSTQQLRGSGVELIPQDCLGGCCPSCFFSPLPVSAVVFEVLVCLLFCSTLVFCAHGDVSSDLASVRPSIHLSMCYGSPWSLKQFDWPALPPHPPPSLTSSSLIISSLPPSCFVAPLLHHKQRLTNVIWMFICTSAPVAIQGRSRLSWVVCRSDLS